MRGRSSIYDKRPTAVRHDNSVVGRIASAFSQTGPVAWIVFLGSTSQHQSRSMRLATTDFELASKTDCQRNLKTRKRRTISNYRSAVVLYDI
nr:hypothetical protein CFP56_11928 [Quercus suber]